MFGYRYISNSGVVMKAISKANLRIMRDTAFIAVKKLSISLTDDFDSDFVSKLEKKILKEVDEYIEKKDIFK